MPNRNGRGPYGEGPATGGRGGRCGNRGQRHGQMRSYQRPGNSAAVNMPATAEKEILSEKKESERAENIVPENTVPDNAVQPDTDGLSEQNDVAESIDQQDEDKQLEKNEAPAGTIGENPPDENDQPAKADQNS